MQPFFLLSRWSSLFSPKRGSINRRVIRHCNFVGNYCRCFCYTQDPLRGEWLLGGCPPKCVFCHLSSWGAVVFLKCCSISLCVFSTCNRGLFLSPTIINFHHINIAINFSCIEEFWWVIIVRLIRPFNSINYSPSGLQLREINGRWLKKLILLYCQDCME